jgi:cobalt-zinc-cadmium efflux system outer membrane protein
MRREEQGHASLAIRIRGATRSAAARLAVAAKRARFYKQTLLPLKQRVLSETQLHYNAMAVGVFQLLQAKRDAVETERLYVEAVRDYWIARAELDQLMAGRLVRGRPMSAQVDTQNAEPARADEH